MTGRLCTLKVIIFMTQKKTFQGKSFKELLFTAKNSARGNVPYFLPPGPGHLQYLTLKYNILNVFWT